MKKFLILFLSLFLTLSVFKVDQARADMPPKAKAFLMVTGYGAAGGALLGFASMAFGTSSRAIAQGASLGLYAGIIFGTYIIVSHQRSMEPEEQYDPYRMPPPMDPLPPPGYDPYRLEGPPQDYYNNQPSQNSGNGFFDSGVHGGLENYSRLSSLNEKRKIGNDFPIYMNLVSIIF